METTKEMSEPLVTITETLWGVKSTYTIDNTKELEDYHDALEVLIEHPAYKGDLEGMADVARMSGIARRVYDGFQAGIKQKKKKVARYAVAALGLAAVPELVEVSTIAEYIFNGLAITAALAYAAEKARIHLAEKEINTRFPRRW